MATHKNTQRHLILTFSNTILKQFYCNINKIILTFLVRERRQKIFVCLSGFCPLRGWGHDKSAKKTQGCKITEIG